MKNRSILFYLSILWVAIFIFQGWWTPPHIDEVYYWRFSQQLDWGYFDHPPMVALMIFLSDLLFTGNLGIRAMTILMTLGTILITWKIIDQQEKVASFYILVFMLPLLHLYGFITTPDVPLLFFGAIYLFIYKRIIAHHRWFDYLIWGIVMGLLLYSKYHGALLILLTLISNPRLFLKPQTYVAGAIGILIWTPHLWWQYEHQWMTFRYHLSERAGVFKWFYPLEYLGNLILLFNPFLIGFVIRTFRKRWRGEFERTLYFTFVGFIAFFALQSFRDHVQPQWLILTYLPFIILTMNNMEERQEKVLLKLFYFSIPILIALHLFMTLDLLGTDGGIWRKEKFVEKIEAKAGDRPVVFFDSYQDPSIYEWYKPETISHSFNRGPKRKNQFNIWMQDTLMNNQEVYVFAPDKFKIPDYVIYKSFDKLKAKMNADSTLVIENPYAYPFEISKEEFSIEMLLYKDKKVIKTLPIETLTSIKIPAKSVTELGIKVSIPQDKEAEQFGFSIKKAPWPGAAVYYRYNI